MKRKISIHLTIKFHLQTFVNGTGGGALRYDSSGWSTASNGSKHLLGLGCDVREDSYTTSP